jgi:6-phosphogluconate dehydrogenase (decarboxylating)
MNIGLLHPGDMGITISLPLQKAGHKIYWPSKYRSQETRDKANQHSIIDIVDLNSILKTCSVVFVICKNGGPVEVADAICSRGYDGVVCDANNLWGEQSEKELADKYFSAGIRYVDASLWGWPHYQSAEFSSDRTMFLYGKDSEIIKSLYIDEYWKAEILPHSAKAHKRMLSEAQ